jgi:hypothetical protein
VYPDEEKFSRVLVLSVANTAATCHFLDLGKVENVDVEQTLFIPAPGTSGWGDLLEQVAYVTRVRSNGACTIKLFKGRNARIFVIS